jgi:SagB-type dehydrogenase family enzyme
LRPERQHHRAWPAPDTLLRRSPFIVGYWGEEGLTLTNYVRNRPLSASIADLAILEKIEAWTPSDELRRGLANGARPGLRRRLAVLHRHGLLESADESSHPLERAADEWQLWSPVATWFHRATRDVRYATRRTVDAFVRRQLETFPDLPDPLPPRTGRLLPLGPFPREGELPEVLLKRRTWRRYGRQPITRTEFSSLLGLTWAVQRWVVMPQGSRFALKTSPSGGACHSIAVYAAALRVDDVAPGLYHYDPDQHGLRRVASASRASVKRYLPVQDSFADAAAVFFMTAVYPRVQWKYRSPRAYRVVLIEAGHLCQTFCLVATWLGLAPFCTAALADSIIERDLGVDGLTEAVLYAAGVGRPPKDTAWAPFADRHVPTTAEPAWARRSRRVTRRGP